MADARPARRSNGPDFKLPDFFSPHTFNYYLLSLSSYFYFQSTNLPQPNRHLTQPAYGFLTATVFILLLMRNHAISMPVHNGQSDTSTTIISANQCKPSVNDSSNRLP